MLKYELISLLISGFHCTAASCQPHSPLRFHMCCCFSPNSNSHNNGSLGEEVNGNGKNGSGSSLGRKFSFDFKAFGKKFWYSILSSLHYVIVLWYYSDSYLCLQLVRSLLSHNCEYIPSGHNKSRIAFSALIQTHSRELLWRTIETSNSKPPALVELKFADESIHTL